MPPIAVAKYVDLVDETGRKIRAKKRCDSGGTGKFLVARNFKDLRILLERWVTISFLRRSEFFPRFSPGVHRLHE